MKLITFGCSFVEGDELIPDTFQYKNTHNIGGVINSNYKFDDYINFGNNGASNERIVLQIMEYINSDYYDKTDFILVGLSGLTRNLKYLNIQKFPFTIPHWDYNSHIKNTNHFLSNESDFEDYMNLVLKYEVNDRNQLVQYFLNCMTIKNLLHKFDKYLIFQSIDSPIPLYNMVENDDSWNDINMIYSTPTEIYYKKSTLFFDKNFIESFIGSNLNKTQMWINFSNITYQKFLGSVKGYTMPGGHPSEIGAKLFFEKILKKHIDKILK